MRLTHFYEIVSQIPEKIVIWTRLVVGLDSNCFTYQFTFQWSREIIWHPVYFSMVKNLPPIKSLTYADVLGEPQFSNSILDHPV